MLAMKESRCIAGILRKKYLRLFQPEPGLRDSLPVKIQDGYRYRHAVIPRDSESRSNRVCRGARRRLGGESDEEEEEKGNAAEVAQKRTKKLKEVYLVNRRKYHSTATEEELDRKLSLEQTASSGCDSLEVMHRIIQARIR